MFKYTGCTRIGKTLAVEKTQQPKVPDLCEAMDILESMAEYFKKHPSIERRNEVFDYADEITKKHASPETVILINKFFKKHRKIEEYTESAPVNIRNIGSFIRRKILKDIKGFAHIIGILLEKNINK